jgi:hypothetical protein
VKHKNPPFLGWVLQFDFFDQIKMVASLSRGNNKISVSGEKETNEEWTVARVIDFDPKAHAFNSDDWKVNHWMLPIVWNQAGYDAACLVASPKDQHLFLKIVQITKAKKHSLDLIAFETLINAVSKAVQAEIRGIEIVFLLPEGSTLPTLDVKGAGRLKLVEVGEGPDKWVHTSELEQVTVRYFKPYCKAS